MIFFQIVLSLSVLSVVYAEVFKTGPVLAGPGPAGPGFYAGSHIPIVSFSNVHNPDSSYRYSYETGNGIAAHEEGHPTAAGPEGLAVTSNGAFSYTGPDGVKYSITYTADENGFHPVGAHIPTPPPIPEAILHSLRATGDHYTPSQNYLPPGHFK